MSSDSLHSSRCIVKTSRCIVKTRLMHLEKLKQLIEEILFNVYIDLQESQTLPSPFYL